jgi:hypothetical protein
MRLWKKLTQNPANGSTAQTQTESDIRHYAPIQTALSHEAAGYDWKRETGDIQSYQHNQTGVWLHIDPQGQFYDRQAQPIAREHALSHTMHTPALVANDNALAQSSTKPASGNDQGFSL